MDLTDAQSQVDTFIRRNGGYWDRFQVLAHLTEELGEVASALQQQAGLRPHKATPDLAGEVGDLLFTLAVFANLNGIDLDAALNATLAKFTQRDPAP
jgi:NTP pyrophosphatase (non-canonical NTP hydrolase)